MTEVSTSPQNRRLGRGLSALLGGSGPAYEEHDGAVRSELREIAVVSIARSPFQPRKQFDPESLGELASSIKEHGVLQPLIVREVPTGFQLVAGERRWQAAQKAGLKTVPCRVVDVIDKVACEFALEENLKRKDLNDLEKAQAFRDYINQFECSIEELARSLSMSRSAVSNMLRLLELTEPVKQALHAGKISAGHARALLPLQGPQQLELCGRIQAEGLSVRAVEAAVKTLLGRDKPPVVEPPVAVPAHASSGDLPVHESGTQSVAAEALEVPLSLAQAVEAVANNPGHQDSDPVPAETISFTEAETARTNHVVSLEGQLRDLLGVKVQIQLTSKDAGAIVVPFANSEEFERIVRTLRRAAA